MVWFEIEEVVRIAKEAGRAIMAIYDANENWERIADFKADGSPLTVADKRANAIICEALAKYGIPIMSEENAEEAYEVRKTWKEFWCVDPLDGTKEFIKRNGQFTVNIGLVRDGQAVAGVVHVPATGVTYYAADGEAFRDGVPISAAIFHETDANLKIVASLSHKTPETQQFIDRFTDPQLATYGSSLKLLMVAEGSAHVYPRLAPCMEWDTCAAHAVVDAAGGEVLQLPGYKPLDHECQPGKPLRYNKEDTHSFFFVVYGNRKKKNQPTKIDEKNNKGRGLLLLSSLAALGLIAALLAVNKR
mmetsp:Transcript_25877/g.83816  ORF Transcript_25877/g.83816 Transcript_25877/m.83816 type:complete len:303 (-) Transcript_25877:2361-3269(-)